MARAERIGCVCLLVKIMDVAAGHHISLSGRESAIRFFGWEQVNGRVVGVGVAHVAPIEGYGGSRGQSRKQIGRDAANPRPAKSSFVLLDAFISSFAGFRSQLCSNQLRSLPGRGTGQYKTE